jgi:hypothetical protein
MTTDADLCDVHAPLMHLLLLITVPLFLGTRPLAEMLAADEEQATKDEDEHTANQSLAESARSARDMQAAIKDVSTTSTSPGLLVCALWLAQVPYHRTLPLCMHTLQNFKALYCFEGC